jgi:hypothetical protein
MMRPPIDRSYLTTMDTFIPAAITTQYSETLGHLSYLPSTEIFLGRGGGGDPSKPSSLHECSWRIHLSMGSPAPYNHHFSGVPLFLFSIVGDEDGPAKYAKPFDADNKLVRDMCAMCDFTISRVAVLCADI